jgi:hypothetical protein
MFFNTYQSSGKAVVSGEPLAASNPRLFAAAAPGTNSPEALSPAKAQRHRRPDWECGQLAAKFMDNSCCFLAYPQSAAFI